VRIALVLLTVLAACAGPTPRVVVGPLGDGLETYLARHPLTPGQNIRADEVQHSASASWFVVQVRTAESPHRHMAHDLTVTVVRGAGTLILEGRRVGMRAGDVALIPRGALHFFTNEGRTAAVALVVFTPTLDAPDTVPGVDSQTDRR
jgi:quercetin dioxygenase-like cupin family protein